MSASSHSSLLRRISFRRGLNFTIMAMGVFTLVLIVVLGKLYQQLTINAEQQTLNQVVAVETTQIMQKLAEDSGQLGLDIQSSSPVRQAILNRDKQGLSAALSDEFRRYFVTAGIIKLEAIIVLDTQLHRLGSAVPEGAPTESATVCPGLLEKAEGRQGGQRLQPLSQACLNNGHLQQQVMVPAGLAPYGYIIVASDPAHNLLSLEKRLGKPIRLTAHNGALLYRSPDWLEPAQNQNILLADFNLPGSPSRHGISIQTQEKLHDFHSKLGRIQYIVLALAILATLVTMMVAHYFTRKIILEPLQILSQQLRGSDAGRRFTDREQRDHTICEFTELQELYGALQDMALTDPLTQLPNRLCFERRLEQLIEFAREHDQHHALCYLDLDQFKVINDSCGHAAGDLLLQQLASLFRDQIRVVDTFARVGGDEFAVLLEHCPPSDAMRIANQIRQTIKDFQFFWRDRHFNVGVSIGVVPIHAGSGSMARIMSLADASCYVAKQQGRNRVHLYRDNDSLVTAQYSGTQWAAELQQALSENRFRLFSQTVHGCSVQQTEVEFCETLVWLERADGKLIAPGRFLPAAEKYNLSSSIDQWVLRQLLEQIRDGRETSQSYSVNIAGQSLADDTFLNFVIGELDNSGIDPSRIIFELTESAAATDFSKSMKFISTLKGIGCRFALDDFGTGLSSFTYLQNLTVDYVKIDGSFVSRILRSDLDLRVLEAITHIGKTLDIKIIAECVESDLVFKKLQDIGVDYAQGFLLGEPRPFSARSSGNTCHETTADSSAQ